MKCSNCHREMPDDAAYCADCGRPLRQPSCPVCHASAAKPEKKPGKAGEPKEPTASKAPGVKKSPMKRVLIAVLALVVAAGGGFTVATADGYDDLTTAEKAEQVLSTLAEPEFRLVVNTASGNYESDAYTFEEQLTQGNDLPDSGDADTSNGADVCDIVLDTDYTDYYEFGNICAYDSNGNMIWSYETGSYPATELTQIYEVGLRDGCYYFVEGGTVVAMDAASGEILWRNSDFQGAGASAFAEDCICMTGYYGPDFFAVSYDGTTLCNIDIFDDEYWWGYQIDILDNEALVYFDSTYPATVFRVNLDTWEYAISDAG